MKNLLSNYWKHKYLVPSGFVLLFAAVGVIVLFASHAATPYAAIEAETGATGGASSVSDSKASGGSYLQFGSESTSSGGCTYSGTVAPCIGSATTGASGWTLKFDDEFNGTGLDASNWTSGWPPSSGITSSVGGTSDPECYDPANISVSNGELDLSVLKQAVSCGGITSEYTNGFVTSDNNFSFTYGFAEARMWLGPVSSTNSALADWPAFWMTAGYGWPATGEIDVLEGLSGQACYHFHYGTSSATEQSPGGCASGVWSGGWHTFAMNWQSNAITFYYDGKQVGQITSGITSTPLLLLLGPGANPGGTDGDIAPYVQRVDYVRVWQQ